MSQESNSKPIIVYTTEPCARCRRAKDLLDSRNLPYEEVNLAKDPVGRRELAQRTGHMTFPQVVVGDHAIGGFDDLAAAVESGELDALVA